MYSDIAYEYRGYENSMEKFLMDNCTDENCVLNGDNYSKISDDFESFLEKNGYECVMDKFDHVKRRTDIEIYKKDEVFYIVKIADNDETEATNGSVYSAFIIDLTPIKQDFGYYMEGEVAELAQKMFNDVEDGDIMGSYGHEVEVDMDDKELCIKCICNPAEVNDEDFQDAYQKFYNDMCELCRTDNPDATDEELEELEDSYSDSAYCEIQVLFKYGIDNNEADLSTVIYLHDNNGYGQEYEKTLFERTLSVMNFTECKDALEEAIDKAKEL